MCAVAEKELRLAVLRLVVGERVTFLDGDEADVMRFGDGEFDAQVADLGDRLLADGIGDGLSGGVRDGLSGGVCDGLSGGVRIAISGNVPPVDVLRNGTHDEIAASVRDCILQAADNPKGFTLCPGCTTPVNTSLDNMIAFMNAAATYGRGARKGALPRGVEE